MAEFIYTLETIQTICEPLWTLIEEHRIVLLNGQMGAGKTTLVKYLCAYKNITSLVNSPTFSIVNEYVSEQKNTTNIFHLDLYRLKNENELFEIGITEIINNGAICFIEWPHLAKIFLPQKPTLHVQIGLYGQHDERILQTSFTSL